MIEPVTYIAGLIVFGIFLWALILGVEKLVKGDDPEDWDK